MKKLFLSLTLFLFTTLAIAQSPMTPDQKADETVNKLKTEIALTDEQIPKVKEITVERITKVTAANKKNGADKQKLQFDNKRIFGEWETKLKGILTEEQYAKYVQSKNKK
jgi:protein CpxP